MINYAHVPGDLVPVRRGMCVAPFSLPLIGLQGCDAPDNRSSTDVQHLKSEKSEIAYFDVNLKSYLERPVFDVFLNGRDIGVADGPPHGGKRGLITGVPVPLGPQLSSWRLHGPEGMPGNGGAVKAVNQSVLIRPDPKLSYLGVDIYPDNTVELTPEGN